MCVCMCVCLRACVRACVCVCVCDITITLPFWFLFHTLFTFGILHFIEMRVDRFSTPVTARFSECSLDLEIEPWPCDGNLMLPHPKGTKANDTMCQASASFPEVSGG